MLQFSQLPDEIKALVIEHLEPDDVIPFSLVCRKVHSLSKDRIQRHLELQEIYSELHIDQDHHPLTLLYAIRKNPEIASYIKYVEWHGAEDPLRGLSAGPLHYGHDREVIPVGPWDPAEVRTFMPDLRPALNHAGAYVISWAMFRDRLSKGRVNACFLLLLFHLPKLVRLRFTAPTFDAEFYYRMFTAWSDTFDPTVDLSLDRHLVDNNPAFKIPGAHGQTFSYPHRLSPPSLQVVEACDDAADPNRLDFAPLSAFAALPSVRTLRVKDSSEIHRANPLPWLMSTEGTMMAGFRAGAVGMALSNNEVDDASDPGYASDEDNAQGTNGQSPGSSLSSPMKTFNLRALEITDCQIPAVTFHHILPRCPNLTSFKMSFASGDPTIASHWTDFTALFDLLRELYAHTLTALSLVHPLDYGSTAQAKSFQCFTVLKWLEISLATLLPYETWREKEEYLMRSGGNVPRLIDVLPESLEDLILGTEIAPRALSRDRLLSGWPRASPFSQAVASPNQPDATSPMTKLLGMRSAFDDFLPSSAGLTDPAPSPSTPWRFDRPKRSRPSESELQPPTGLTGLHTEWQRAWEQHNLHSPPLAVRPRKDSRTTPPPPLPAPHAAKRRKRHSTQPHHPAPGPEWPYPPTGTSPSASSRSRSVSLLAAPPTTKPPLVTLSRHNSSRSDRSPTPPSPRPPGLRHELRRITYFCCSATVVECDCVEADERDEYEEGFVGLEIRRRRSEGWGAEHEVRWRGEGEGWGSESCSGGSEESEGREMVESPLGEDVVLDEPEGGDDYQREGRGERLGRLGLGIGER